MELLALKKEVTDDIRWILEGIGSGVLPHQQQAVHCGSAHCVCGWKAVIDFSKEVHRDPLALKGVVFGPDERQLVSDYCINEVMAAGKYEAYTNTNPEWMYARTKWGLTKGEAVLLFEQDVTLENQFSILEKLERGYRYSMGEWEEAPTMTKQEALDVLIEARDLLHEIPEREWLVG